MLMRILIFISLHCQLLPGVVKYIGSPAECEAGYLQQGHPQLEISLNYAKSSSIERVLSIDETILTTVELYFTDNGLEVWILESLSSSFIVFIGFLRNMSNNFWRFHIILLRTYTFMMQIIMMQSMISKIKGR